MAELPHHFDQIIRHVETCLTQFRQCIWKVDEPLLAGDSEDAECADYLYPLPLGYRPGGELINDKTYAEINCQCDSCRFAGAKGRKSRCISLSHVNPIRKFRYPHLNRLWSPWMRKLRNHLCWYHN